MIKNLSNNDRYLSWKFHSPPPSQAKGSKVSTKNWEDEVGPEPSIMFLQITEICKQSKENILLLLFQDSSSSYVKDQHLWQRLFVVANSSRLLLTGGKTVALLEIPAWATPIPLLSRIIVTHWQLRDNVWQCGSRRTCHSSSCRTCHTVVLEGGQEARLSSPWHHFSR